MVPATLSHTALVITQAFGEDGRLVLDEKAIGVAVAAVALALRTPVLLAITLAGGCHRASQSLRLANDPENRDVARRTGVHSTGQRSSPGGPTNL